MPAAIKASTVARAISAMTAAQDALARSLKLSDGRGWRAFEELESCRLQLTSQLDSLELPVSTGEQR